MSAVILTYLEHMSFKVATRTAQPWLVAQTYFIGLRTEFGWLGGHYKTACATHDGAPLMILCRRMLAERWSGEGVSQVQVTALDPRGIEGQLDFFADAAQDPKRARANAVMDAINRRYGQFTLAPARLLQRSDMPDVIAPAWKPNGHRQTI